jgi:carbonic anhydrase/acetyltransferase-like protein (isoleucine patch superfamily)
MNLVSVRGHNPVIGEQVFLADTCRVIGQVSIGAESSVWFSAVLRGDVAPIKIGKQTNIQDGAVIHGTLNKHATNIGDRVTIGHLAMLHGCDIGDGTLIGMQSTVMDGCKIGKHCIVGAQSLVVEGSVFEDECLIVGSPAKVKRKLRKEEIEFLEKSADNYKLYAGWYK